MSQSNLHTLVAILAMTASLLAGCPEDPADPDTGTDTVADTVADTTIADGDSSGDKGGVDTTDVAPDDGPDSTDDGDTIADDADAGDSAEETSDAGDASDALETSETPITDVVTDTDPDAAVETDGGGACIDDDKSFNAADVTSATAITMSTDFTADYSALYICEANDEDIYQDWFKFDAADAGTYLFEVTYPGSSACFDVSVYNSPDGDYLGGSPDLTGAGSNIANVTLDAGTTYYIQVAALDAAEGCDAALTSLAAGPYALSVSVAAPCEDDAIGVPLPDDAAIVTLASGVTTSDLALCAEGEEDYFVFELAADGDITVTVDHTDAPGAVFDIYIYDDINPINDNIVDVSLDVSGTDVNTLTTAQTAGTYYINVYSYTGSGPYSLTVGAVVPECAPVCANNGLCVATNTCDCTGTGFEGPSCEIEITCTPVCANSGVCVSVDTCDCAGTGFIGATCEEAITCTPVCANSGVCVATDTCDCDGTGFFGPTCEEAITCAPVCANGGACVATDTCDCDGTGFFGPTCESLAPTVWVNELHYDNTAGDADEGIEIGASAGTDLAGWTIELYNGSSTVLTSYGVETLSGVVPDQSNGFGTLWFAINGLQNGGNEASAGADGLALIDAAGVVVEFLSYEGVFTPTDGAAMGMESVDIGVAETGTTPADLSLQRTGPGVAGPDFTWTGPVDHSRGEVNAGQTFP